MYKYIFTEQIKIYIFKGGILCYADHSIYSMILINFGSTKTIKNVNKKATRQHNE